MKINLFNSKMVFLSTIEKSEKRLLICLLLVQLFLYAYLLLTLPLHYDEWFSWRYFSGTTFFNTFSNYPAPNNHVFYNMVARCFVVTKMDVEIAIRIPSLLSSLITSYYFYKICRSYFSQYLSIALLTILISYDHFAFYSIEARGYSFVNLFCVLLIYSSMNLSLSYSGSKNRLMFVFSQFLGLYTVPSFLYVMLPVGMTLFAFLIAKRGLKQLFLFVQDYFLTLILVLIGYSGILFFGDSTQLLNPEKWANKFIFNDAEWLNNLLYYLDTRFYDIFGFYKLKTASLLVIITIIYYLIYGKLTEKFTIVVCAFMFFSPLFIVILHKIYPIPRTLYYLLLPSILLLGFMLNPIILRIKHIRLFHQLRKFRFFFYLLLLSLSITNVLTFAKKSSEKTPWEYHLEWLRKNKLKDVLSQYHEISRTNSGFEFYPAEIISFMYNKENSSGSINVTILDSIKNQDLLIINGSEKSKYINDLNSYKLVLEYNDIWIYQARKIKPVNLINE